MAIQLKKAQRKRVKLKIGMSAPSGGGKTLGSLFIGYGLLKGEHPDWSDTEIWDKIAVIDTENGSGELYSESVRAGTEVGAYWTIPLAAPFEPQKYIDAIKTCKEQGIEVTIIDSLSQCWSGAGGLLEKQGNIAKRSGNSYTAWREVTPLHNALVDTILQTDMHMICTMRAKTEYVQEKGENGKTTVRKVGLEPVQRDGLIYEFSMFLELDADHQAFVSKDRTGVLDGQYFVITPDVGKKLAAWLNTGATPPPPAANENPPEVTGDALSSKLSELDAAVKELLDSGADRKEVTEVIKTACGMANFHKIADVDTVDQTIAKIAEFKESIG